MTSRYPVGAIKLYTFSNTESGDVYGPVSLLLPELEENNHYEEFYSHTGPFTAKIPRGQLFAPSGEARIHVMTISTTPGNRGPASGAHIGNFTMIVQNKTLLSYLRQSLRRGQRIRDRTILWEDWGPANTRWMAERHARGWLRSSVAIHT